MNIRFQLHFHCKILVRLKLRLRHCLLVTQINHFPERMLLEGTRLMLDVYKKAELSFWISYFKWNKTIWSLVLVDLIILKVSVVHKITNLKQLFIALSWTVLFVGGTEMCLVDRFVYVLVTVSPFCRNIPWVEVDLATWATEKKTISHFSLSFMYCFGVNLGCDTHTNHCSHVAANVLLKME